MSTQTAQKGSDTRSAYQIHNEDVSPVTPGLSFYSAKSRASFSSTGTTASEDNTAVKEATTIKATTMINNDAPSPMLIEPSPHLETLIQIRNNSGSDQTYMIYPEPPIFNLAKSQPKPVVCVYAATGSVAHRGFGHMTIAPSPRYNLSVGWPSTLQPMFAVTGLANGKLASGVRLNVGYAAVLSVQHPSYTMKMGDGKEPRFEPSGRSINEYFFQIKVSKTFDYPHRSVPFVGLGIRNPYRRCEVICVTAWEAVPGKTYLFHPNAGWNCSRGKANRPGTIMDPDKLSSTLKFGLWSPGSTVPFVDSGTGVMRFDD